MFRHVSDFSDCWDDEYRETTTLFSQINDSSLSQKVYEDGRSLGFLAWHIIVSIGEMAERIGLKVDCPSPDSLEPVRANEIVKAFQIAAQSLSEQVKKFNDDDLKIEVDMYGEFWANGKTLDVLIKHQAHHRGQMTVLMRQAGLKVHGVYGPSKEQWSAMGLPPQA